MTFSLPIIGEIPISGSSTAVCPECHGDGEITHERPRRINELYDSQIQALYEAEVFREVGDEEDQAQLERAKQQAGSASPAQQRAMNAHPEISHSL